MDIACRLDEQGLAAQRARYRRLAPSVADIQRGADRLTVVFAADLERGLLDELLAVERECCPFFELDFDAESRRLAVGVSDARFRDALDAIAYQLANEP
jgi:hypothetical protein